MRTKHSHTDERGVEHVCKFSEGDWIAYEFPQSFGQAKPGRVERIVWSDEKDGWVIGASFRFTNGAKTLYFCETPLSKIRWTRRNGRSTWFYC